MTASVVLGSSVSPGEGVQRARIRSVPDYASSTGVEAVDLLASAGLVLDPWQADELTDSLGERADGKWAAFDVAEVTSRQNGKGSILEGRQVTGLFLLRERLQIHTAHEFKTCQEHFLRVKSLIENTDWLRKRCHKPRVANGEQEIQTLDGCRLRFLARSRNSGRGFTADVLYLDEAFELPESVVAAAMPTLSARPNPQIWYTSSAVDQEQHPNGLVLARLRARALKGGDPSLAYFEHSAALDLNEATEADLDDVAHWAMANPGLGRRITVEHVERERRSMDRRSFLVERLSVGDWPDPEASASPIDYAQWLTLGQDNAPKPVAPVMFAVDMNPLRTRTAISVVGEGRSGEPQVELAAFERGSEWVVAKCVELRDKHQPLGFVIDQRSPAGSLIPDLRDAGIEPIIPSTVEVTQACGSFHDAVRDGHLHHTNDPDLSAAVKGAAVRPVGDAWMWTRRGSTDISPLVAATLALWGWTTRRNQANAIDLNVW